MRLLNKQSSSISSSVDSSVPHVTVPIYRREALISSGPIPPKGRPFPLSSYPNIELIGTIVITAIITFAITTSITSLLNPISNNDSRSIFGTFVFLPPTADQWPTDRLLSLLHMRRTEEGPNLDKYYKMKNFLDTKQPNASSVANFLHFSMESALLLPVVTMTQLSEYFTFSAWLSEYFTFSAWYYLEEEDSSHDEDRTLFSTVPLHIHLRRLGKEDGRVALTLMGSQTGEQNLTIITPSPLPLHTWIPIGLTLTPSEARVYIDGHLAVRGTIPPPPNGHTAPVQRSLQPIIGPPEHGAKKGVGGYVASVTLLPSRAVTETQMTLVQSMAEVGIVNEHESLESESLGVDSSKETTEGRRPGNAVKPGSVKTYFYTCRITRKDRETLKKMSLTVQGTAVSPPIVFYPSDNHRPRPLAPFQPRGGKRYTSYTSGGNNNNTLEQPSQRDDTLPSVTERRDAVRNAMKQTWNSYETYAWGWDELAPVTREGTSPWGNSGATLIDAMDTLYIMNLREEFSRARDWVRDEMSQRIQNCNAEISLFETVIRVVGGLLGAYALSGDEVLRTAAEEWGDQLSFAFRTPSGYPYNGIVPSLSLVRAEKLLYLAQVGTLQMEYKEMGRVTRREDEFGGIMDLLELVVFQQPPNGLFPIELIPYGEVVFVPQDEGTIKFGAMGDSFYEYLLKVWIQGGKKDDYLREAYDKAMDGVHEHLIQRSTPSNLTYIAEMNVGKEGLNHKMDHLVCFMGATLALGAYTDPQGMNSKRAQRDLTTAKALAYTCYQMYARTPTGLAPEIINFTPNKPQQDFEIHSSSAFYILRPETVETFFILYKITRDVTYQDWGWEIFEAIEAHCKVEDGLGVAYGSYPDVREVGQRPQDRMESFFLAETLKYLYLLFDEENELDVLNEYILTTEAHPLPILNMEKMKEVRNRKETRV